MKALVTGATGFIGSYLVEALLKRGYEVTCLARKTSDLKWVGHLNPSYIYSDLSDIGSCAGRFNEFDYIFHLAGLTKAVSEKDFFAANADGTKRLLKVASEQSKDLKRFVYLSSLAASGPCRGDTQATEDRPPDPVSVYGKSKLEGERAVMDFRGKIPVTVIRPPAVYGPRDADFLVMFRIINKGFFPYWGTALYSMIYIEDLIKGIVLAAERKEGEGEIFFLSDDMVYTNEVIAEEIASALGTKARKIRLPRTVMPLLAFVSEKINKKGIINRDKMKELRFSNWTCDSGKAKNALGFRAKITLREGIKWTADWYRIHQWI